MALLIDWSMINLRYPSIEPHIATINTAHISHRSSLDFLIDNTVSRGNKKLKKLFLASPIAILPYSGVYIMVDARIITRNRQRSGFSRTARENFWGWVTAFMIRYTVVKKYAGS